MPNITVATKSKKDSLEVLYILAISFTMVILNYLIQGDLGINLMDEGYLWYGTLRTADGEVPIRDFQAYDPGRYYWTAAWSFVLGDGILDLRLSVAFFQAIGLWFGLLSARTVISSRRLLIPVALVLMIWMIPRHKLFEHSLAMAAVYFGTLLLRGSRESKCYFIAGLFIGLTVFFGRNHGVYTFLAFMFILLFLWRKLKERTEIFVKRTLIWAFGVVIGGTPILAMFALVPGFFRSFIDSVFFIFRLRTTNLTLPVPWPWAIELSNIDLLSNISRLSVGLLFISLPIFVLFGIIATLTTKRDQIQSRALLISCTAVGLPYMHHAFSRADFSHLAQSIHPFLLGGMALPVLFSSTRKIAKSVIWMLVLAATAIGAVRHPYALIKRSPTGTYESCQIGGEKIWVHNTRARLIEHVEGLSQQVGPHEGLLILPYWPGLYCITNRKSPIREIFLSYPETEDRQASMISSIIENRVRCAIVDNNALDGREDRRLSNTNKILWEHLNSNFDAVEASWLPRNYLLLCNNEMDPLVPPLSANESKHDRDLG